jgi:glycine/D-amino acid oxidase-like deaminating enzyme/nitrite reductase/ring-hydroxylating ferredoxin subunit
VTPPARTTPSLWRELASGVRYPSLTQDLEADVVVVGGGIAGVCAAWEIQRAGRSVVLLEADVVAGAVTGHTTAKVSALQGLLYADLTQRAGSEGARLYGASQLWALQRLDEIVGELDIACDLETLPSYSWADTPETLERVHAEVEAAVAAGLEAEFVPKPDMPFDVLGAIRLDDQRQFHPVRFVDALSADVVAAGGSIHEGTRVVGLNEGDPCTLTTADGPVVRARDVVVATGFPVFDRSLLFGRLVPHRELVVAGPLDGDDPRGMWITPDGGTRSIRTAPSGSGRLVIVTGERFRPGATSTTEGFERLETWAKRHVPVSRITHRWAAQDNDSSDRVPFVGPLHPLSKHVYVATGFGGWGMSNGIMAGRLLASYLDGDLPEWAGLFDPRRLNPIHEAWPLLKGQVEVATHFAGDRLKALTSRVDQIQPGDGDVVLLRGRPVAVHRQEDGALRAVTATCTHLACLVQFNGAERSWDCPCHGSRFDLDGAVLNGPAVRPLKRVRLPDQESRGSD